LKAWRVRPSNRGFVFPIKRFPSCALSPRNTCPYLCVQWWGSQDGTGSDQVLVHTRPFLSLRNRVCVPVLGRRWEGVDRRPPSLCTDRMYSLADALGCRTMALRSSDDLNQLITDKLVSEPVPIHCFLSLTTHPPLPLPPPFLDTCVGGRVGVRRGQPCQCG
jgi:hypothetical protein